MPDPNVTLPGFHPSLSDVVDWAGRIAVTGVSVLAYMRANRRQDTSDLEQRFKSLETRIEERIDTALAKYAASLNETLDKHYVRVREFEANRDNTTALVKALALIQALLAQHGFPKDAL